MSNNSDGTEYVPEKQKNRQEWIEVVHDRTGEVGERGRWYWALWGADGEFLATGQVGGYESEKACVAAVGRARSAMGKHPWIMRSEGA